VLVVDDEAPVRMITEQTLHAFGYRTGVAVARNGEVVRRAEWPATALAEGDRIELVSATQGG